MRLTKWALPIVFICAVVGTVVTEYRQQERLLREIDSVAVDLEKIGIELDRAAEKCKAVPSWCP